MLWWIISLDILLGMPSLIKAWIPVSPRYLNRSQMSKHQCQVVHTCCPNMPYWRPPLLLWMLLGAVLPQLQWISFWQETLVPCVPRLESAHPVSVVAGTHASSTPAGPAHHRGGVKPTSSCQPKCHTDRRIGVWYLKGAHQSGVDKRLLDFWNY